MDGIPPKLLLQIVEQISIPFACRTNEHIACNNVQFIVREGSSSVRMERSIVPLFEKGSRNRSDNDRPVKMKWFD